MCFNPQFCRGPNLSFFGLGPWAIIHGIAKLVNIFNSQIWTLITSFKRSPSKLSENHKFVDIGFTEFKLWQLKESPNLYCNTLQVRFSIACSLVVRERDMTGSLPSGFHAGGESLAPPTSRRRGASVEAPTDEYSYGAVVRPATYGRPKKMRKTLSGTLAHTQAHTHTHTHHTHTYMYTLHTHHPLTPHTLHTPTQVLWI